MSNPGPWRKSSRSAEGQNNNCVEVRLNDGLPEISDSKLPEDRPILPTSVSSYNALLSWVRQHDQE